MKFRNLTGQKFNRLTAINRAENLSGYGQARWKFLCDCGKEIIAFGYNVAHNKQKSCGCYKEENPSRKSHGKTNSASYLAWSRMLQRCENPLSSVYKYYGKRGIKVCEQWKKFENFYADMGEPPTGKSLDRIDNNKNYSPENCRWATPKEQTRNRRITIKISWKEEIKSLAEWADLTGIPYKVLHHRYKVAGRTGDHLFAPVRKITCLNQDK